MSEDYDNGASRRDVLRGGALGMGAIVGAMGLSGVSTADAATPAVHAAAAAPGQTFWLQIPGIDGPGTTKGFEKQIPLLGFGWGIVSAPSTPGTGTAAGKVTLQPFVIRKRIDKSSPVLFLQCASGKHLTGAVLRGTRVASNGRRTTYLKIALSEVLVSSIQHSEAAPGVPAEVLHLGYAKAVYTVDGHTVSVDVRSTR